MSIRLVGLGLCLLVLGLAHWLVPVDQQVAHAVHVAMRKLLLLPVVLGAIWFQMRGALLAALCTTLIYVPHVVVQWAGHLQENMSQFGDVLIVWAVAVLTGWMVQRERSMLQALVQSHAGSVRALVAALDAREHNTEVHSLRVQAYARRIADEMGLSSGDQEALETGALLHDVGKIGVPDSILLKPGPLDEPEWEAMRQHPQIGRDILRSAPLRRQALDVVLLHHERYDGTGYPLGLAGDEIPLPVRVFSIADAFDALTSERPYKEALAVDRARERIEAARGEQFDPDAVDAFLRVPVEEWSWLASKFDDQYATTGPPYAPATGRMRR